MPVVKVNNQIPGSQSETNEISTKSDIPLSPTQHIRRKSNIFNQDYFNIPKQDKDALDAINLLRKDPNLFIELLQDAKSKFNGDTWRMDHGQTINMPNGVEQINTAIKVVEDKFYLHEELSGQKNIPELAWSPTLARAANEHALDIRSTGQKGHIGSNGTNYEDRIKKLGHTYIKQGESIAFGPCSGGESIVSLILAFSTTADVTVIDNLFDPKLRRVGISNQLHPSLGYVTVFNFAGEIYRKGDQDKIAIKLEEFKEKELDFINPGNMLSFEDVHKTESVGEFKYKKTQTRTFKLEDGTSRQVIMEDYFDLLEFIDREIMFEKLQL